MDNDWTVTLLGRAQAVLRRIEPVCDDLMGEALGTRPVQDWGAVNNLLVESERLLRDIESHRSVLEDKSLRIKPCPECRSTAMPRGRAGPVERCRDCGAQTNPEVL